MLILAGSHFLVSLKFVEFHLEASESCRYDYLEIRDGPYGFSPLLYKGCGQLCRLIYYNCIVVTEPQCLPSATGDDITPDQVFMSSRQYLWIRFFSDELISRKGFLVEVTARPDRKSVV